MKTIHVAVLALVYSTTVWAGEAPKPDAPPAKQAVKVWVIKTVSHSGTEEYRLASPEELKTLQSEIAAENRYFDRALSLAEKEWRAADDTAKKPFPRSSIEERKLDTMGSMYTDQTKAEEKLASLQQRGAEKEKDTRRRPGGNTEKAKKEAEREAAKLLLQEKARSLFETKLGELTKTVAKKGEEKAPQGFAP